MSATTEARGFGRPGGELVRALAAYLEPPTPGHARLADALGLPLPSGADYAETFLFDLHPYASVHLGAEGMLGGAVQERVAGFWRAVGRTVPPEPDHLASLLGLYAALADERASAGPGEAGMIDSAATALIWEHLAGWVFELLDRVRGDGGAYAPWAELTHAALGAALPPSPDACGLPVHLREAPALPDPRIEGGSTFVAALVAPVRTGFALTRTTLARTARSLGLGVRAGERRYMLEHLLGVAAPEVLAALADLAAAAADRHAARAGLLGPIARFGRDRARATSSLLGTLAAEGMTAEATPR